MVVVNEDAPRIEDRLDSQVWWLRAVYFMAERVSVILVRFSCRIFTFCGRVVVIIILGSQCSGIGVEYFLILWFRYFNYVQASNRLIVYRYASYQRRYFNDFRLVDCIRRRLFA